MERPVETSARMQMAQAAKGRAIMLKEIQDIHILKTLPGRRGPSQKQKEKIQDQNAADLNSMQQRYNNEKERERRASLG